ncbi:MAG: excisionase [Meiothermus sp.]
MLHEKLAYTPVEVAKLLGLHLNSVRKFIKTGALPSFRLGRKVLIPRAALERLLGADNNDKNPRVGPGGR